MGYVLINQYYNSFFVVLLHYFVKIFFYSHSIFSYSVLHEPVMLWLPNNNISILSAHKQLTVQGFIVSRWKSRYPEAIKQMAQWIQEGKIKYDETIIEGFEKMPEAFIGLLTGTNLGKMIVKAWKISNVII